MSSASETLQLAEHRLYASVFLQRTTISSVSGSYSIRSTASRITNAPRHPIKAVNEGLIDLAAPNESKQSVQRRTIERRSGIAVVVKAVGYERPTVLSLEL